jgi:CCR4-NOT transcription complex subunit 1
LENVMKSTDQAPAEAGPGDLERGTAGLAEQSTPLLSPQEVLEKYQIAMAKIDSLAAKRSDQSYASLPSDDALVSLVNELPAIVSKCVKRDEAALGIAQKVVKLLYESVGSRMHFTAYLAVLEGLKDVTSRLTKELTGWVRSPNSSTTLESGL